MGVLSAAVCLVAAHHLNLPNFALSQSLRYCLFRFSQCIVLNIALKSDQGTNKRANDLRTLANLVKQRSSRWRLVKTKMKAGLEFQHGASALTREDLSIAAILDKDKYACRSIGTQLSVHPCS